MSVWVRAGASAGASAAAAAAELLTVASLFFSFSLGEWEPVLMGTGSRNFIGSTDIPSERSGTHLKKKSYMFFWRLGRLLCIRKTYDIRKWTKSVFFGFFQSYGYENGPDSYGQIRLSFS